MQFSKELNHQLNLTLKKIRAKQKPGFILQALHHARLKLTWFYNEFLIATVNSGLPQTPKLQAFMTHCQRASPQAIFMNHPEKSVEVSIIIPAYNKWHLTSACINSILETCDDSINYELILADDCSTDETVVAGELFPGLIISKTQQNSGFLKNCNQSAKKARGRYLLLLNNDTIVLPNWLSALYQTLEEDPTIAITGSKMLRPNGSIQEAGCMLFADGRPTLVGAGYRRETPIFNIPRDVDYISGCSILIRKSFWEEAGGFDERYYHAYYEDSDLAMTAHALGYRVVYQPKSEIVHFRGRSYAMRKEKQCKNLARKNLTLFLEKWSKELQLMNEMKSDPID